MFSIVKKVVAGPKHLTSYEGEELDLTYITDRVIAMAFPASDFIEKTYRNSIQDVASYLDQTHKNRYLVINVSSRTYNYTIFKNSVKDYEWPDHQTPTFATLVQVAYDMYKFLSVAKDRIVAVHCNHGKGRTGTAIISFMLLIGFFKSAKECLHFYNSKRFNKQTYGVDQPCQLRYLNYISEMIATPKIPEKLICYRLKGITHRGLTDENYYVNITSTRSQQLIHEKVRFNKHVKESSKILLADIFIELFCEIWSGSKRVTRMNCNLYFLGDSTKLKIKGEEVRISGGHTAEFQITLHLQYYCLCHLPTYQESSCRCRLERHIQEKMWQNMMSQIKICKKITKNQASGLLYNNSDRSPEAQMDHLRPLLREPQLRSYRSLDNQTFKNKRQEKIHAKYLTSMNKKQVSADEEKFIAIGVETSEFERKNCLEYKQQQGRINGVHSNIVIHESMM